MLLSAWLRIIRLRFLFASVIAVGVGLSMSWYHTSMIDISAAIIALAGVLALHISVDLLNDYWDYKRGIDTTTTRTRMSGGTGVLPEGLLQPSHVYRAGIASLVFGAVIGSYFVVLHGFIIAIILGFAILAIYFYSTRIVDAGLGELFVGIKGAMIVLGVYFIQTETLSFDAGLAGALVGSLSGLVLFVTAFPDHDADKLKGRKTLVILAGPKLASRIFWLFPILTTAIILTGVIYAYFPATVLISLLSIPIAIRSGIALYKGFNSIKLLLLPMSYALLYSRSTGVLFVVGLVVGSLNINLV